MEVYRNKPIDISERCDKEVAVYDMLDRLNIEYERVDHDAIKNMDGFREIDKVLNVKMCKNLFLTTANKKNFYLFLMPGNKKFVTKVFSKLVGASRLSFAKEELMERYLNTSPGSASILGLMNDIDKKVKLVIDSDVYNSEFIGCHPLVNTSSLKIKTSDIVEKFLKETGHDVLVVDIEKPEL